MKAISHPYEYVSLRWVTIQIPKLELNPCLEENQERKEKGLFLLV